MGVLTWVGRIFVFYPEQQIVFLLKIIIGGTLQLGLWWSWFLLTSCMDGYAAVTVYLDCVDHFNVNREKYLVHNDDKKFLIGYLCFLITTLIELLFWDHSKSTRNIHFIRQYNIITVFFFSNTLNISGYSTIFLGTASLVRLLILFYLHKNNTKNIDDISLLILK